MPYCSINKEYKYGKLKKNVRTTIEKILKTSVKAVAVPYTIYTKRFWEVMCPINDLFQFSVQSDKPFFRNRQTNNE